MILAIDPGNVYSGWALIHESDYLPTEFGKDENEDLLYNMLEYGLIGDGDTVVIERIASYGMSVGRDVLETCEWVGRFAQAAWDLSLPCEYVYRREEKLNICHSPNANDTTIRQALVDRFAYGTPNHGKGTKAEPGFFYGFKADIWQAYAVGVTYLDRKKERER